nr:hypothetical protein [Bacillus sp. YC2]
MIGGFTVIHTPGHTSGHISPSVSSGLQDAIAGDAMIVREGKLQGPNLKQIPDIEEAYRSVEKLAACDIEKIICYHGGLCDSETNKKIADIAAAGVYKKNFS